MITIGGISEHIWLLVHVAMSHFEALCNIDEQNNDFSASGRDHSWVKYA